MLEIDSIKQAEMKKISENVYFRKKRNFKTFLKPIYAAEISSKELRPRHFPVQDTLVWFAFIVHQPLWVINTKSILYIKTVLF